MEETCLKCKGGGAELGLIPLPVPQPATNGLGLMASAMVAGFLMGGGSKPIAPNTGPAQGFTLQRACVGGFRLS